MVKFAVSPPVIMPCTVGNAAGPGAVQALQLWVGEHPPPQTPTAGCPNQLKAFQLLYLIKLCRFSSHVHTL